VPLCSGERRYCFHGQSGTRCGSSRSGFQRYSDCGSGCAGSRRNVDGSGEYVSVSSQADTETADLERERKELAADPAHEHEELRDIYIARGLDAELAAAVATQLMAHDALGAHGRDELGISEALAAKPVQAALSSAATFAVGAVLPLLVVFLFPAHG
jgi:VIT1/CCC1 family predicted Fe2+/Mn2+ transporter